MHKSYSTACCHACNNNIRSPYSNCCCKGSSYFSNCCGPAPPRTCTSCILANWRKNDEWKCYSRCLTGFYTKNTQNPFHTPLWRRAERERAKAASMMELSLVRMTPKKSGKRIARRAEIVIDKPTEHACGGPLGDIARRPTCMSHRMAQLLMQQKLCDKCNCDPYESVPDVPLAFYPKWECTDLYGNQCDDKYAHMLANEICTKSGRGLQVQPVLSKPFLKSLNQLYANVGGGGGGGGERLVSSSSHRRHRQRRFDSLNEFIGFFGKTPSTHKTSGARKHSHGSHHLHEHLHELDKHRSTIKLRDSEPQRSRRKSFEYPTGMPKEERGYMKVDTKTVKKYLRLEHIWR